MHVMFSLCSQGTFVQLVVSLLLELNITNTITAPLLAPLAFIPNDAFQRHVRDYVICHVFTEMEQLQQEMSIDDDEVYNEEKSIALVKAINDRRVALAGYLKLIVLIQCV